MSEDDPNIGLTVSSSDDSASCGATKVRLSVDLIAAARWHLAFLASLSDSNFLHDAATILQSIRRYRELWMPLIHDLSKNSSTVPMILPPLDYCISRFGRLVERPAIFDDGNAEYASNRCRGIWTARYPSEPFDLEISPEDEDEDGSDRLPDGPNPSHGRELFVAVSKYRDLYYTFLDPFVSETVYLVSARQRYRNFLHLCRQSSDDGPRMSFPVIYARDVEGVLGTLALESRVVGFGELAGDGEVEETIRIWEQAFDEPYERAGACFDPAGSPSRESFYWDYNTPPVAATAAESNRKYRALQPRWGEAEVKDIGKMFFRLRTLRCHREMKLERPVSGSSSSATSWQKAWDLCCEFGTRGVILDLRRQGSGCLGKSKSIKSQVFMWNELLRAPSLAVTKHLGTQVKAMVSVTPPVQAPYLLKCVPDRVTDDKGSMISDVILRMNHYHPQAGRWLSRTVLDCHGRECFVIRFRVGEGFWRRGAETPRAVKWEDRIIEVREGSWSYVASSVGTAPQKVVGTAVPRGPEEKKVTWALSTGDLLRIRWQRGLEFELETENSIESIRLEVGRKLQFQVKVVSPDEETHKREEEEFITFIRFSPESPAGRATALFNWRLLAVEFLPEEDAVFVLLACMAIVRTVSEMKMDDVGHLLVRRRVKEAMAGTRDWGSVMLHSTSSSPRQRRPWFWNPKEVFASAAMDAVAQSIYRYSPSDGKGSCINKGSRYPER
ncbi:unnamed protein product [Spirodela intermedia]|uniref:GRPD C-terminal domain-containing protein n=1 Tax=Spirodela intermedia TaxID=51605 RepID=A0A7I8IA42_SPIIN|nr:unnamed protein product [Spirodela intermedia]CAA6654324.1 unnamed protein product [Spirodela intermedia]